jgi:hypothetical protein
MIKALNKALVFKGGFLPSTGLSTVHGARNIQARHVVGIIFQEFF